ncbi:C45 family autoproteolytic acyltransferase/hydolase [Halobacillus litoralis]|uniref:C45 family autoproteolytic acyltransferase/hydolase n=1 Tax=Halobacillus litoralis TaxID=45668 RepID=UPI001CFCF5FD|nr:C45 family peptidase [Halobacillus litoralis]
MKNIHSEVIQFRGRHDDFGYTQGNRLRGSKLYNNHKLRRKKSLQRYHVDMKKVKDLYLHYAPGVWDEIKGLAEGLQWPVQEVIHEYSGWQQDWENSGCSILTGDRFFARNYDYHPKTYEGRFLLFQPSSGTATIGPGQRIIGRTDGMNEYGLCVGYNFVNRIHPEDGFICCSLTRFLLENCKNTEEAVHLLRELPHRHSFNYVIYDRKQDTAIIEASPRGIEYQEGNACTNHFSLMPEENRRHLSDSEERLTQLKNYQKKVATVQEAFEYLNDTNGMIFSKQYSRWTGTIHTVCFSPESGQVLFGLGGDTTPVQISFNEWLKGTPAFIKKVIGRIDTKENIPYMDA